jgi:hypothetical protein
MNRVTPMRLGAGALPVHPGQTASDNKPAPLLVVDNVGNGRTLALHTDSAWNC